MSDSSEMSWGRAMQNIETFDPGGTGLMAGAVFGRIAREAAAKASRPLAISEDTSAQNNAIDRAR
jgi:hypothetical protein